MVGYSDLGFTKVLAGILFGVGCDHHDRSHRAGNCVSMAASLLPAARAATVEPIQVLREE